MGRELAFYSFSMDIWRVQRDALSPAEAPKPDECPEGAVERPRLSTLVTTLLRRGQTPEPAPDASPFWYALSQVCATGGKIEDGAELATDRETRIVVRYLGQGRPLFGDALDPHSVYGWLDHEDEITAFERIVASPAWTAYTAPGRYKQTGVAAFERAREIARAWAARCTSEGRDVFFSSQRLDVA